MSERSGPASVRLFAKVGGREREHVAKVNNVRLYPRIGEEGHGIEQKSGQPLLSKTRKHRIDVAIRAGGKDFDLPSDS